MDAMPENITVGVLKPVELRALYARSRFVVVPLLPTDTDNGVSVTLEAMAMGKAVICSHVEGQKDVIQAGRTGIFVPQGDPEALRNAIQFLWTHPEEAERMGQAAREYVEKHHTIDQFVDIIKHVVDEAVAEKSPVRQRTGDEASENVIVENASVSD
jgi:glycosyltransferase involved in cell wall biosynthesis